MDQGKYDLLMAQMNHKRQLKEQYLYQTPISPLAQQLGANMVLRSIRERVDIFSVEQPRNGDSLSAVLEWISLVAERLGCGVYELFIEDERRDRAIIQNLLAQLRGFQDWSFQKEGFCLPGFGFSPQASATLCFQKNMEGYFLSLKPGKTGFLPEDIPLWQETEGPLQAFMDEVLTPNPLQEELETLKHLIPLLEEMPQANIGPILLKTAENLEKIRCDRLSQYQSHRTEKDKGALLLLGGAVSELKMLSEHPENPKETLQEIIYMVESANDPM